MTATSHRNPEVVKMYEGKPYIETTITIRTPLWNEQGEELQEKFRALPAFIKPVLKDINQNIEDITMENFEADVYSVESSVRNLFKGENKNE